MQSDGEGGRDVDGAGEVVEAGVQVVGGGERVMRVVEGADGEGGWVFGDARVGHERVGVEAVAEGEGEGVAGCVA